MDDRIKTYQCENYRAEVFYNYYSVSDQDKYGVQIFLTDDTASENWELIDLSFDFATAEEAESSAISELSRHRDSAESEIKEINS